MEDSFPKDGCAMCTFIDWDWHMKAPRSAACGRHHVHVCGAESVIHESCGAKDWASAMPQATSFPRDTHLVKDNLLLDLPHSLVQIFEVLWDIPHPLHRALVGYDLVSHLGSPQSSFRQIPSNHAGAKRISLVRKYTRRQPMCSTNR